MRFIIDGAKMKFDCDKKELKEIRKAVKEFTKLVVACDDAFNEDKKEK